MKSIYLLFFNLKSYSTYFELWIHCRLWTTVWSDSRGDYDELLFLILLGSHPEMKSLSGESFEPILKGMSIILSCFFNLFTYLDGRVDVIAYHQELEFLRGNTQFEQKYSIFFLNHIGECILIIYM